MQVIIHAVVMKVIIHASVYEAIQHCRGLLIKGNNLLCVKKMPNVNITFKQKLLSQTFMFNKKLYISHGTNYHGRLSVDKV